AVRGNAPRTGKRERTDHAAGRHRDAHHLLIGAQAELIRELTLPVLQVHDHVLIVPVVGMIDTARARLLTERLLSEIRDRRGRGVVLDVTGGPVVDTAVANHILHTVTAARLMGATVI